jgi:hypothetical protein
VSAATDKLHDECVQLARLHTGLKDCHVCQTFYDDGWWNANVASGNHCIGVYGHASELAALRALKRSLEKPATAKPKVDEMGGDLSRADQIDEAGAEVVTAAVSASSVAFSERGAK